MMSFLIQVVLIFGLIQSNAMPQDVFNINNMMDQNPKLSKNLVMTLKFNLELVF